MKHLVAWLVSVYTTIPRVLPGDILSVTVENILHSRELFQQNQTKHGPSRELHKVGGLSEMELNFWISSCQKVLVERIGYKNGKEKLNTLNSTSNKMMPPTSIDQNQVDSNFL